MRVSGLDVNQCSRGDLVDFNSNALRRQQHLTNQERIVQLISNTVEPHLGKSPQGTVEVKVELGLPRPGISLQ